MCASLVLGGLYIGMRMNELAAGSAHCSMLNVTMLHLGKFEVSC